MTDTMTETPQAEATEAAPAEPAAEEAPKGRPGPKMCTDCGEHRQVGGDPETVGKAVTLCIQCIREHFRKGKCPFCMFGFNTKSHKDKCPAAPPEDAAA